MEVTESIELLKEICDHMFQPCFVHTHKWSVNDAMLWNNRCLMHAAMGCKMNERRRAFRTTLAGTMHPGRYYVRTRGPRVCRSWRSDHLFDERKPEDAFIVIEVEDVAVICRRAVKERLPVQQNLKVQAWGHRSFCVREPNEATLYFSKKSDVSDRNTQDVAEWRWTPGPLCCGNPA